jgi:rhodanese-related sulfurtransferase
MTSPQRLSVKFFASPNPGSGTDLGAFIPLFHKFIQNGSVEGTLIDVADYAHVPEGPGVILIGHEVDYGLDLRDGRTGLLVTRKHCGGHSVDELTEQALRMALGALVAIEADGSSGLSFATDKVELHVTDRLLAPNDPESFSAAEQAARPVGEKVFGDGVKLARIHEGDPRRGLALEFVAPNAGDAKALLDRLGGAAPAAEKRPMQQSEWEISVEELARMRSEGEDFVLVDVREQKEFDTCNLGGLLIPLGTIDGGMNQLDKSAHVVVHCKTGGRSAMATKKLRDAGFENAWNVGGGILAWSDRVDPSVQKY